MLWGKLAEAAAKLAKNTYVEVELRHHSYQKEVSASKKTVALGIAGVPVLFSDDGSPVSRESAAAQFWRDDGDHSEIQD